MYRSFLWDLSPLKLASSLKGCIPTPKTLSSLKLKLKLYDCKCFYLLNDDFGEKFENHFSPKLFTKIFGDLIKNPPNICSPKIFSPKNFFRAIGLVIYISAAMDDAGHPWLNMAHFRRKLITRFNQKCTKRRKFLTLQ